MQHKKFLGTRKDFVLEFGAYVNQITKGTGILPGTLFSQAILESSGKVENIWLVGGSSLSREANNFFGIKCHSWKGAKWTIKRTEFDEANDYYKEVTVCFRKYNTVEDSIKDYVNFLLSNERYKNAGVFKAKTVEEQAKALQKAGYAGSESNYSNLVTGVYNNIKPFLLQTKKKVDPLPIFLVIGITISAIYLTKDQKKFELF